MENKAFDLLRSLLEIKRLNYRKDGMESVLDWDVHAQFIKVKNEENVKEKRNKWIVPHMHYLLEVVETQEIPFEYDLRGRIIDVDLLYFVYSVIHPIDRDSPYWYSTSSVYLKGDSSDLFKKIKHDEKFATTIATELFNMSHEEFIKKLIEIKVIFEERINSFHTPFLSNPFQDF